MKYMGSKARFAKHLIPIMETYWKPGMTYIEPFVGGANMIDRVPFEPKLGRDGNQYVIDALKIIRDEPSILPKDGTEIDKDIRNKIKENPEHKLYGYALTALSYSGIWAGGFCNTLYHDDGTIYRDYAREAYDNALKQSKRLQGIHLEHGYYDDFVYPDKALIYCDPPYKSLTGYKDEFDHEAFWQWVRDISTKDRIVLVSEQSAPEDFQVIWSKDRKAQIACVDVNKKATEKLYAYLG